MDRIEVNRRATVVREARRSRLRSALVLADLGDPAIAPALARVDAECPGLVDTERARLAHIVARLQPA